MNFFVNNESLKNKNSIVHRGCATTSLQRGEPNASHLFLGQLAEFVAVRHFHDNLGLFLVGFFRFLMRKTSFFDSLLSELRN